MSQKRSWLSQFAGVYLDKMKTLALRRFNWLIVKYSVDEAIERERANYDHSLTNGYWDSSLLHYAVLQNLLEVQMP